VDIGFEETLDIFEIYCSLNGEIYIRTCSSIPILLELGKSYDVQIYVAAVNAPTDEVKLEVNLKEVKKKEILKLLEKTKEEIKKNWTYVLLNISVLIKDY